MTSQELQTLLSANIRRYRQSRNLSQADLAEKADVSINHVCNIENGERLVSSPTLAKFATALGVEPFELFKPIEPLPPDVGRAVNACMDEAIAAVTETLNQIRSYHLQEEKPITDPRKLKRSEGGKGGRPRTERSDEARRKSSKKKKEE